MDYQKLDKFELPENFRGKSAIYVQLWWAVQATFFRWSPQVCYGWRRWLLRRFGAQIGRDVLLRPSVTTTYPWKVKIGNNSWVGDDVVLYSLGPIIVGDDVVISQRSYICTGTHSHQAMCFDILCEPIEIKEQAWLATDVFIGPGVVIGKGAVIGARSSVYKSVEGGRIYKGNPIEYIRSR